MQERPARFLTIPQVAEELATTEAQVIALLKRGDLPAIKLGGRGQWRIERSRLEEFIDKATPTQSGSCKHVVLPAEGSPPMMTTDRKRAARGDSVRADAGCRLGRRRVGCA